MGDIRQKLIISLLVINAVLICYFGISVMIRLNEKSDMLKNEIVNLNREMSFLQNNITNTLKNELDEKYNMVSETGYEFMDIDSATHEAVVDLSVKLKSVNPNSRIYIAYGETGTDSVQEAELTPEEGLTYSAKLKLDLQKNYWYDVIEKVEGGGHSLLNTNKQYLELYDEFYSRRVDLNSLGSYRNDKQIDFDFQFSVNDFGMDEFKPESITLEIRYKDEIIDKIDIKDKLTEYSYDANELEARYRAAVASGEIDEGMSLDEFRKSMDFISEEKDSSRKYYTYTHRIRYDDYPELQLNSEKAENLHINLIVECRDGYRFSFE